MINALLNVEAIFMTNLYCQLFYGLCLVYLPLGNPQFVKIPSGRLFKNSCPI